MKRFVENKNHIVIDMYNTCTECGKFLEATDTTDFSGKHQIIFKCECNDLDCNENWEDIEFVQGNTTSLEEQQQEVRYNQSYHRLFMEIREDVVSKEIFKDLKIYPVTQEGDYKTFKIKNKYGFDMKITHIDGAKKVYTSINGFIVNEEEYNSAIGFSRTLINECLGLLVTSKHTYDNREL